MKYVLRPKQIEAVDKIDKFILNPKKNHGLFIYPTSFGKSLIIANLASKYPNKFFINVTNSKELLRQNYEKFTSYGAEASICSSSLKEIEVGKVTFATIGTLIKFTDFFETKEVIIIDDEAQEGSAKGSQLDKFTKKLKNYKLVGVSATPFRLSQGMDGTSLKMMNRDRKCIYKSIEDVVQISEVVSQGYWSPLIYDIRDMDESSLQLNTSGTDYTDTSVKVYQELNDVNNLIIEEVKKLIKSGRESILISVPFIADALEIESKLDSCRAVYSGMDTKDRDEVVSSFKALKIRVVVQCKILTVGFDHSRLDCIVLAKPSNSLTFYYQLCIDKQTEILTKEGFKKVNDISLDTVPYGYDMLTGEIRENKLLNIIDRCQYDFEKIMSFSNNRIDFRVSSEHDMVFKGRTKNYKKLPAKEMLKHKTQICVPVSGIEVSDGSGLDEKYLKFIGWFLSDGYHNKKGNQLTISQSSTSPYINELRELLINCNFDFKEYRIKRIKEDYAEGINFMIPKKSKQADKLGWNILEKYIDKKLNKNYEVFTKQELTFILYGLIKGDGCNKGNYSWKVSSHLICTGIDEVFTDNLQSLLVRRGFYCKKTKRCSTYNEFFNKNPKHVFFITVKDTNYVTIPGYNDKDSSVNNKKQYQRSRITTEDVIDEELWCVETEMGTIITRRNGKVMIMGNCGRGVRIDPNKKDCLVVDFSGNCERFGKVETITIENQDITKGWAVFNKNILLSNYPLNTNNRPTRESLLQKINWEKDIRDNTVDIKKVDVAFYFGRYKNKKVSEVLKENKSYLTWILDQKDFNWYGENGYRLKQCIQRHLGVFIEEQKPPVKTSGKFENNRNLIQNYTDNIKTIADLNNLW